MLASIAYLMAFLHVYATYISVEHAFSAGMLYRELRFYEYMIIFGCIGAVSLAMPPKIDRPSALFLWFLFVFFVVPAVPLTFLMGQRSGSSYYMIVFALAAAMILASLVVQHARRPEASRGFLPDNRLVTAVVGAWIAMTAVLIVTFRDTMSFAGIEDVYYQRALAKKAGVGAIVSYIQTYYAYVINPALIGFGLIRRSWLLSLIGVFGLIITYTIDAQKVVFVIIIAMLAFFFSLRRNVQETWIFTTGILVLTLLVSMFAHASALFRYVADVVLLRAIAIPGGTYVQYYDFFSSVGYTYWSSVRGLDLVIAPPAALASDPAWPALGVIVGQAYFAWVEGLNNSASAFSGEGVAAAGAFGVMIIGAALSAYLRLLDASARSWDRTFVIVVTVPIAMAMANAHLSTVLVSFGGAFWLVLLSLYRPKGERNPIKMRDVGK